MTRALFEETQRFKKWWIWVLCAAAISFPAFIFEVLHKEHPYPEYIIPLIISVIVPVVLLFFLFSIRLETRIDANGISYRFKPIHRKARTIPFSEIQLATVRKYDFFEFGGYGIRYNFGGRAYNISGNTGIQLVMKNGKKILIGTQKPEEAEEALKAFHNSVF